MLTSKRGHACLITCTGAEAFYTLENNLIRTEDLDGARMLDRKVQACNQPARGLILLESYLLSTCWLCLKSA